MFLHLKQQVQSNFNALSQQEHLFYANIDRDAIWEAYLNGFSEEERQGHNCNCCKSFLRQFGGITAIIDGQRISIWDNISPEQEFVQPIENLSGYVRSLPIANVFLNPFAKCGTDKNFDPKTNSTWNHFYIELPRKFIVSEASLDTVLSTKRTAKETLKRALTELTQDSVETVLELIAQGSIYRGTEFQGLLTEFLKLKKEFIASDRDTEKSDNFCWVKSQQISGAISSIRNSAIGTLLIDLSEGLDLNAAVVKFERVVAPTNYKRPTALITQGMIDQAKTKLEEMGLVGSLERRYATESDLNIQDILYIDKSSQLTDVFGELSKETLVNPKSLAKLEEISIDNFITNVLPTTKGIEVLLENKHTNNMVSLLTSLNANANGLFKWPNNFSWAYTGGTTDSPLRDKVAQLGGRVDGVFRFSHSWNEIEPNQSLMDLHVFMPGCDLPRQYGGGPDVSGKRVGWNQRKDITSGGNQDVDYTSEAPVGYIPVENITFPDINRMPEGTYTCMIHNWSFRKTGGRGKAEIEFGGTIYQYEYPKTKNHEWITVAMVTLKNGQFTIDHKLPENASSIEKWGVKTNQFTKVKNVLLSPNYWGSQTGNKHFMFILEGCISDETPRPFFNEFLKEEFNENRKVFEVLGTKVKVEQTNNQLSGVGFSETKRDSLIVRVEGTFKRTLKINF